MATNLQRTEKESKNHYKQLNKQTMNEYRITVKSDSGKFTFRVIATDEETAKMIVMISEGCPESAIVKVKSKKLIYKP